MVDHSQRGDRRDMYETGQRIRYDAREHLLWLARHPKFQMLRDVPSEIETDGELPARAFFGWHYVPPETPNRDRLVDRPVASARKNIAGVLPPAMRGLTEILCLVATGQLTRFCERIEIRGSRPLLRQSSVDKLQDAVDRRLGGNPTTIDRKHIRRLLEHIDPAICKPPVDYIDPALRAGQPVAFSASALYLGASVYGIASTPAHPVLALIHPGDRRVLSGLDV